MELIPLLSHTSPSAVVAYQGGAAITAQRFVSDVAQFARGLPAGRHVLNVCADRYRFTVGLAACLITQRVSLLPSTHTPEVIRQLAGFAPDAICLLNPLHEIALIVAKHGKGLIVDAMSSFGALEIDARKTPFDAVVAASGKCLEGVPGMGFVLLKRSTLEKCEGNCHSLAMDLYDQWVYMNKTTQWRFTPPTHVVASLEAALNQYWQEGGQKSRGARYAKNCHQLISGLSALGLRSFLDPAIQAPIIVTFFAPEDPNYSFKAFYDEVKKRGYVLYPGKLTTVETFRVGCMGAIDANEMRNVVGAIADTLKAMGINKAATTRVATK
jgi:2-aminoethylphosphonate-pyruvate transaminase